MTSSASDWALDLASYPMSVMIAAGGISAALLGKQTIKVSVLDCTQNDFKSEGSRSCEVIVPSNILYLKISKN